MNWRFFIYKHKKKDHPIQELDLVYCDLYNKSFLVEVIYVCNSIAEVYLIEEKEEVCMKVPIRNLRRLTLKEKIKFFFKK